MNRNPGVAEHTTPFEGIIATFTKIDKTNGSTGTRTAGAKAHEQETLQRMKSNAIECRGSVASRYSRMWSFVSTVFRMKCNPAIPDMTKRRVVYFLYIALMFQISGVASLVSHA
jgi:hypothetical protein